MYQSMMEKGEKKQSAASDKNNENNENTKKTENKLNPTNHFNELINILEKLKSRLPMFIISIYCTVTTLIFGNDFLNLEKLGGDQVYFRAFYISLCVWAILWDIWHCILAYEERSVMITNKSKILFTVFSVSISFPLFIVATNIVSFGLPLYLFFNFDKNMVVIFYGSVFPMIYFFNVIEQRYWKGVLEVYIEIKEIDDEKGDTELFENSSTFGSGNSKE